MFGASFIVGLVNLAVALIKILLGLRVVLRLLAANPTAQFVSWIYDISRPLLEPFIPAFDARLLQSGSVIEFSAIFAMIIYALIGYLIVVLIGFLENSIQKAAKRSK